ncbi:FHA domain-containing protein [Azospirillum sp. RWY-5-1]|uniref:FHA domain-containing protein n=2 Tax=Azospirillum oleiclasticum TaxID=2735135 RepID=A0ABX2T6X9_9PROT|nr:FHA domain-containing protein [Azospirillum oleiclasticum]NYZ18694.1 FHA domain-containing protein [Azospirillum oleiclasticum]
MISRHRPMKYEVVVELKGRPSIDGVFDDEALAMDRAKFLLAQARFTAVRVVRTNQAGKEETVFEKAYSGGGKVTTISHIEEAAPCRDVLQVYGFNSRMTLLRLLRAYWDDQQVIPAEQLHRYMQLRYLEREATLFNPALSRLATLQSEALGVKLFDRQDELARWFVRLKELAQEGAADLAGFDRALATGGTAGLLAAAASRPAEERDRIVTHAFSTHLEPYREWGPKLRAVLRFHDEDDGESVRVVDEFVAEIMDGREPVRALIGYAPDLASALLSLIAVVHGDLDDRLPHTEDLLALSRASAGGGFDKLEQAILNRIAGALDARHPLSKQGPAAESKAFHMIADRLATADGFRGGADMASALTRRAKLALAVNGNDLPFEETVSRLSGRFSTPAARLGYLLDLGASPVGRRRISYVIGLVAGIFEQAQTASELAPIGVEAEEARRRMGERLRKAGVPRALADALVARMSMMNSHPPLPKQGVLTADTVDIGGPRVPARLALSYHGHRCVIPDAGTEIVIGRSHDCHILLDLASASRHHAVVRVEREGFVLEDLSRNGTELITAQQKPRVLNKGDKIQLGRTGEIVIGSRSTGEEPARITWEVLS